MTCDELHQLYFEMKDGVFKKPSFGVMCNTEELERILKEKFEKEMEMDNRDRPTLVINDLTSHVCIHLCDLCLPSIVHSGTTHYTLYFFSLYLPPSLPPSSLPHRVLVSAVNKATTDLKQQLFQ